MTKQILVPINRSDRAQDFIPCLGEVARPGMKVVFMAPYLMEGLRWSRADSGRKAINEGIALAEYYAWAANLSKVKDACAPAVTALSAKGVDAEVVLYAGSLRRAIRERTAKGAVHMIVRRASVGSGLAAMIESATSVVCSLARPGMSPVMLINP